MRTCWGSRHSNHTMIRADTQVHPYNNPLILALSQRERGFRMALSHSSDRGPATLPEKCTHLSDEP